ncbi:GyrI-like domain-containing protein [Algoriphagus namhaensis]
MQAQILHLPPTKLLGKKLQTSLTEDRTKELWQSFAPQIKSIPHRVNEDKISLQIYPEDYFENFSPLKTFVKWAGVEVYAKENPTDLDYLEWTGGLYAVFDYRGQPGSPEIFQYIFSDWLPKSTYQLDQRPHFERLGGKYRPGSDESEEQIWIPVRQAKNETAT